MALHSLKCTIALAAAPALGSCAATRPPDLADMSFSPEPLLGKALWHDLITEDLEDAKRFHSGMFGWSLETTASASGREYILARNGNTYVAGLLEALPCTDGKPVSRWLPYVSVSNVDRPAAANAPASCRIRCPSGSRSG